MGEEGEARQPGAPGGPGAGEDFAGAAGAVQQRDVLDDPRISRRIAWWI
jgi:hypothetical protein